MTAHRKVIERLCENLGIPIVWGVPEGGYRIIRGQGTICVDPSPRTEASNACHDIAHWLVASPSRRKAPNFGLGSTPDGYQTRPWVSADLALAEELRASLLGILIERELGLDYMVTWHDHSWRALIVPAEASPKAVLREMERRGEAERRGSKWRPAGLTRAAA